jgi:hypothetical protein
MTTTVDIPTTAPSPYARPAGSAIVRVIDRWIYVCMASLFLVTALVGFVPDSIRWVAGLKTGDAIPMPPILHVHAVLMASWILLLLAQTTLMATGRSGLHQKLGLVSLVLLPAMVVATFILVPTIYREVWNLVHAPPPGTPAGARRLAAGFIPALAPLAAAQIRTGIVFPVTVGLALLLRRTDSDTHKRLMILATAVPLAAAIDRMGWLTRWFPGPPLGVDVRILLWISPMLVWDLFRLGRVQKAYVIWAGLYVATSIPMYMLGGSPWWTATANRLMGVTG